MAMKIIYSRERKIFTFYDSTTKSTNEEEKANG